MAVHNIRAPLLSFVIAQFSSAYSDISLLDASSCLYSPVTSVQIPSPPLENVKIGNLKLWAVICCLKWRRRWTREPSGVAQVTSKIGSPRNMVMHVSPRTHRRHLLLRLEAYLVLPASHLIPRSQRRRLI